MTIHEESRSEESGSTGRISSGKRLFVAFPVTISSPLAHALKRTRINADKKEMEFNWIPEANLHVTINFIGTTDVSRLPVLESAIRSVAEKTPTLKTSLRGMGAFPDEHHMRVLWVGVRKSRALKELQRDLAHALEANGFPQEDRDYIPHLTIGKLRKSRTAVDLLSPFVRTSLGDLSIDHVALYESVQYGSHPIYKCLSTFALSGVDRSEDAFVSSIEKADEAEG